MAYCAALFAICLTVGLTPIGLHAQELVDVSPAMPLVTATYRSIHENPELGGKEQKTSALLRSGLEQLGYTVFIESARAPTAVITVLDTGRPGPTIALRAEMDARKAKEPEDHDPRSSIAGLMHNCGHDAHAAMLLGVAQVLKANPNLVSGRVVFVFQPAEETRGGADDIVNEGILADLDVESIFAQHVVPGEEVGTVTIAPGPLLAGSNYFELIIRGGSSHAAVPFEGSDLPLATAKIVEEISEFPARSLDIANRPVVISVTKVNVGTSRNILPDSGEIQGTIRAFEDIETRRPDGDKSLLQLLKEHLDNVAATQGVQIEMNVRKAAPPTVNNALLFSTIVPELSRNWAGTVDTDLFRGMFSEDFSYYTESTDALYFGLGVSKDGLGNVGVHKSGFTIHPDALATGVELLTLVAALASGTLVEAGVCADCAPVDARASTNASRWLVGIGGLLALAILIWASQRFLGRTKQGRAASLAE